MAELMKQARARTPRHQIGWKATKPRGAITFEFCVHAQGVVAAARGAKRACQPQQGTGSNVTTRRPGKRLVCGDRRIDVLVAPFQDLGSLEWASVFDDGMG